jgi:hypothetical protein
MHYSLMGISWGGNLEIFYYLSAFEIWPDKSGGFWSEGPYKRGITVQRKILEQILSENCVA